MMRCIFFFSILLLLSRQGTAQSNSLVNTERSAHAKMQMLDMGAVHWTDGFWYDRMETCKKVTVPQLWKTYNDPVLCHSFKNFEIAAGLDTGSFMGLSFHDGDFYKVLEAVAALYAYTKDAKLDAMMDQAIDVIGKAQRKDGYLYTKSIIEQRNTGKSELFDDKLSFEAYNLGHLMTAACVHYRATGKKTLLSIAQKATDFLLQFYSHATPEQARNAICPSHYMGIVEMYRTLHDPRYLQLANKLIDIRGATAGTDDNSDRVPFRQMQHAGGHAVRANYLFAGVADLVAETGDISLSTTLDKMWQDVTNRKMYVTGGCGALYDGTSPDGTSYNPDTVQKVHQAYGHAFQLPLKTAHNETCANIGNLLWNWRMFLLSGNATYMDIVELELYNGMLSGISLDGDKFFYTNPLEHTKDFPYTLRWAGGRQHYIALSNCCPPNIVRTIAEVANYAYSADKNGIYVNLYGSNTIHANLPNGETVVLEQTSAYPWNGVVLLKVKQMPSRSRHIAFRIPEWCDDVRIKINGMKQNTDNRQNGYCIFNRIWKVGDIVELNMAMPVQYIESNPLVEESRNRIAVKRGPVVYCQESADLPDTMSLFNTAITMHSSFVPVAFKIQNHSMIALKGVLDYSAGNAQWDNQLYRPIGKTNQLKKVTGRLVPYFAWANRGDDDMQVWIPFR
ncbi:MULTISPECIES: aceric acid hydrolase [Chitinophagaceae]